MNTIYETDAHYEIPRKSRAFFFSNNSLWQIIRRIAGVTVDLKFQTLGQGKWLLGATLGACICSGIGVYGSKRGQCHRTVGTVVRGTGR